MIFTKNFASVALLPLLSSELVFDHGGCISPNFKFNREQARKRIKLTKNKVCCKFVIYLLLMQVIFFEMEKNKL